MNKIKIIGLNTQYSIIKVEKDCSLCNENEKKEGFGYICKKLNKCKIISKHIVSNNGWLPLEFWVEYFTNEF